MSLLPINASPSSAKGDGGRLNPSLLITHTRVDIGRGLNGGLDSLPCSPPNKLRRSVGHSAAGKGPTGKGPRREFRALTSAGQRLETEPVERDLQKGNT